VLEAENITYSTGNRELISNISVSLAAAKLHLIIGPNGAGKSTLIKVLSRLLDPKTGVIRYEGMDIRDSTEIDLAKRRAVLSQAIEVAFPLSVREVVMMGRYPHFGGRPGPSDEKIVDEMMGFFDITEFAHRNYQTLSGGERQRVNFARVLGQLWQSEHEPKTNSHCRYLFLDEPLTFLDIKHQIDFMKKIREFGSASDVVTIGVVHDLNLAARFADQIILMNEGKVIESGAPDAVLTAERIKDVFEVDARFLPSDEHGMHIVFD
jgi:iron complex transport system ATP-binding protein